MKANLTTNARETAIQILESPKLLAKLCGCNEALLHMIAHDTSAHYSTFTRLKKNGKLREITPPSKNLRFIHYKILELLYDAIPPFPARVCGGLKGRSVQKHATYHTHKDLLVTMDVSNFFPSTTLNMTKSALAKIFSQETAEFIASLCTHKDALPQGSPTSMLLSNMCFRNIDKKMALHCKKHNLTYSRYVDDIAISGNFNFRSHLQTFASFIEEAGYEVARRKTLIMPQGTEQIVTGLAVNNNMRPCKQYIHDLRETINDCMGFSPEIVASSLGLSMTKLKNRLTGRVNYVKRYDRKIGQDLKRLLYTLWTAIRVREKKYSSDVVINYKSLFSNITSNLRNNRII